MTRLTLADVERRLRERLGEFACDVWTRWLPGFQKDVAEIHVLLLDDRCEIAHIDVAIAEDLRNEAPDVDDLEWPGPEVEEFSDPLFDSQRSYLPQIARYRRHQGK